MLTDFITLKLNDNTSFKFLRSEINISKRDQTNVFARKNGKTLLTTVSEVKQTHNKYKKFENIVMERYSDYLSFPLGDFVLHLKNSGDTFYRSFLNKYGDLAYCKFSLVDKSIKPLKGLYAYVLGDTVVYIGLTVDTFDRRFNGQGYGTISPKNCYIDGQLSNCRMNSMVNDSADMIGLYVCPLIDDDEIVRVERQLIGLYNPQWNTALRTN